MNRFIAITSVATWLLCGGLMTGRADEKQALEALGKMGAELSHVGLDPAKPVFWVDFSAKPKFADADLKKAVGYLKQLPDLRRLTLASTRVTDKGLAYLKDLKNLEELILSQTRITDAGLKHLEALSKLTEVKLVLTKVTEKGRPA
jgi:hypothetical protein